MEDDEEQLRRLLVDEAMALPDTGVAVAGLAGRFPKADSMNELEEKLLAGEDMVNDRDEARFACGLWGLPPRAGRLKDISRFDAHFFGYANEEANYIDYQLRILYEVVYESILDAGVGPASLRGSNTGVFFGLHCNEFENAMADEPNYKPTGYYSQFAVKVAQYFDLRGLTVTFDAACASGFVGFHNAVAAMQAGTIEQAIVCSCNIPIHPTGSFIFLQMQMLSPTGYSRFLDARADGYVKSEACVSLLLQPKHLALRNYCSVMATATSVDGYKPEGITFPSAASQEQLIGRTKQLAGVSTNHVEYLEAHGTGTPAGDPQEAAAIASVYIGAAAAGERRRIGPLLVGSVKTNMGHSEAASGLCALAKVALMLENELVYKSLHYEQPNSNIPALMAGQLQLVEQTRELRAKIVPLSCYGFGGSNVHALVRANHRPAIGMQEPVGLRDRAPRLVLAYGRSREALGHLLDQLLEREQRNTRNCLTDDYLALLNALAAAKTDRLMSQRGYLLVDRRARPPRELRRELRHCDLAPPPAPADPQAPKPHPQEALERPCHLLLGGLGGQWSAMAAGLESFEPFWATIRRLAVYLEPFGDQVNLVEVLTSEDPAKLESLSQKFVAIVAFQVALLDLLKRQLKLANLSKLVGHSLGEISCAYAAQVLDEREALLVAYWLGRVLDENRERLRGQMVAVGLPQAELELELQQVGESSLEICCINGPSSCTVSGRLHHVDLLLERLSRKVSIRKLDCDVALHNTKIMDGQVRGQLEAALRNALSPGANYLRPTCDWLSSFAEGRQQSQANAAYFAANLCSRVDFLAALEALPGDSVALELGPASLFEFQLAQVAPPAGALHYVSLGFPRKSAPSERPLELLSSLGRLYLAGGRLDLNHFYHGPHLQAAQGEPLFPVRRQTPSVSSLVRWQHQQSFFVPRYPSQFSKSSAKSEVPVDIVQERDKFLAGHCIEGRCLYPATGYLFLIWRAFSFTKRQVYDACFQDVEGDLVPIEFRNVRLLRAVLLGTRVAQIYIQLEEATGRFEIREGGQVVAEGVARSPDEQPEGLLHEQVRDRIRGEGLEVELNSQDIYKQFRVSGYDYGASFQNLEAASACGRYSRVRFNGHFIAFTDSILQSIFLAVSEYAPSGGLFLPTRFDYVRFQPKLILAKIHAARMAFDLSDGSLNTKAKRAIMTKLMERHSSPAAALNGPVTTEGDKDAAEATGGLAGEPDAGEQPLECIFETFCDPVTGVIITDGIEMRGIKASPAPRRLDAAGDVLLESYQFVADTEEPVEDEPLTGFARQTARYAQVCDSLALELLRKLAGRKLNGLARGLVGLEAVELETYMEAHLLARYKVQRADGEQQEAYDIKRNGSRTLLSVLEQLGEHTDWQLMGKVVRDHRAHLQRDLLQAAFTCERLMRPLVETVIENCSPKRLRLLEVNPDDGLLVEQLQLLVRSIEPALVLDYALVHPDANRLASAKLGQQVKTFGLRADLAGVLAEPQLRDLDLLVYKDPSCYGRAPAGDELGASVAALAGAARFVLVALRQRLSLAERLLVALAEPEATAAKLGDKLHQLEEQLAARSVAWLAEAERNEMICVASKCDPVGCHLLLFKTTRRRPAPEAAEQADPSEPAEQQEQLIRVEHGHEQQVARWLDQLKRQFSDQAPANSRVWLCGVASRGRPAGGVVGLVQALRKELGPARLRCFYDQHTFREQPEPVGLDQIERSAHFQAARRRDLLWNCVDESGRLGAFRHFTLNDYLSYEQCRCDRRPGELERAPGERPRAAYANNSIRGDLSSFTWFEAPAPAAGSQVVRVAYAALNFRDVMLATGRLPLDSIPLGLAMRDCQLGLEFAGVGVDGRRLAGMVASRAIASHVECRPAESLVLEVPAGMALEEAASLPVVYATAIMALVVRGRAQRGESLLVHAGSGGVGQAAIRLAAHLGLQVFATVGSEEKRQFLLEEFSQQLSADRIFSSRSCDFEHQILLATKGRGVDLVLNSLADDKLQASIRCLADGGRFLEIGKYDLSQDTRLELAKLNSNKTFHGILLDKLFDSEDASLQFRRQLDTIVSILQDGLQRGYVRPIRRTIFKRHQLEEAFRFMATGKHLGKVLIEIDPMEPATPRPATPLCVPRLELAAEKAYIVTGGLGGFGLELSKWLVQRGARCLLLTSRSGLRTGYQRATLRRLESHYGAQCLVVSEHDCTRLEGARALCELARKRAPSGQLGAVFHLAMVLKDSLLEGMEAGEFEQVCAPKVATCEHLDAITRLPGFQVDFFVAFSSVSAGKGNAGQANYAYANSCVERLVEKRRHDGLHGLAVQWGPVGDVGVAYENLGGNEAVLGGCVPQRMPSCLATLAKLLRAPFATCLSVVPVQRTAGGGPGERADLVSAIMHVLGIKDASKVSEQATLAELGLDSLMAVEIRQYIEREFELTLNIQEIRALTIARIRQINDAERPAGRPAPEAKQAAGAEESAGAEEPAAAKEQQQQQEPEARLNKSLVAGFVPALALPERDFCALNGCTGPGTPLFFVPPIHGRFERLEPVCAQIGRPCIGLNWTRRLGRCRSLDEAVAAYLEVLRNADWPRDFCQVEANSERVVDLVGYSYGATVAFEMMVRLHELEARAARQLANGLATSDQLTGGLRAGRLLLLDGSPRQIELGAAYLNQLAPSRRQTQLSQQADELLMVFVRAHAHSQTSPERLLDLQRQLGQLQPERKVQLASQQLADLLAAREPEWRRDTPTGARRRAALADAMEAFCRRYELISNYQARRQLPADCALVRASQLYLTSTLTSQVRYNEDLGLQSLVRGQVHLHVLEGDHESFLAANARELAAIITKHCAPGANCATL